MFVFLLWGGCAGKRSEASVMSVRWRWIAGLLLLLLVAPRVAVFYPDPFFPHRLVVGNLEISSDQPFPHAVARELLGRVAVKLAASGIDDPEVAHRAFICNAPWRQRLFLAQGIAGLNYYGATGRAHVFLRPARFYDNRLLSPSGRPVGGNRTLDYYLAHEFTHTLVGRLAGNVPLWLGEGYADWVGLGPEFSYAAALKAYRAPPPEIRKMAGDYLRYDLMVAYLLEVQGMDVRELLKAPPDEASVEREAVPES